MPYKIRACVILLNNNILYNNTSIKYKRLNEHKIKIVVWIKIIDQISIQIQNTTKYLKINLTKNLIYKNAFKTYCQNQFELKTSLHYPN